MTDQQSITRDTMIGPFPLPPVDDELRADARSRQPGEWIAFVDPAVDPSSNPPEFAAQGAYKVGDSGEIDDYYINPGYYPSETRAGYRFNSGLEITLWRVKHGYNPLGLLVDSLYHAQLHTFAEHEGDTRLPVIADPDHPEISLFPVCTSSAFTSWAHTTPISGSDVLALTGDSDVVLDINPGTSLALRLRARDLAGLVTAETPHLIENIRQQQRDGQQTAGPARS